MYFLYIQLYVISFFNVIREIEWDRKFEMKEMAMFITMLM